MLRAVEGKKRVHDNKIPSSLFHHHHNYYHHHYCCHCHCHCSKSNAPHSNAPTITITITIITAAAVTVMIIITAATINVKLLSSLLQAIFPLIDADTDTVVLKIQLRQNENCHNNSRQRAADIHRPELKTTSKSKHILETKYVLSNRRRVVCVRLDPNVHSVGLHYALLAEQL
jgi:hypothetical protein